ncbi:MAG: stage II sporulation protein R [Ruminococcaceae bacterium]|nr:stage II sporulation protein R [Oscillospiraceae bacterium]
MKLIRKLLWIALIVCLLVWGSSVLADRYELSNNLIRLHVVANSDSEEDQAVKLQVRDAINGYLQGVMENIPDVREAKAYLKEHIAELEALANRVLQEAGFSETAKVTLTREEFPTRSYDTFTLPAGVYESLRVSIGDAQGQNWWCVVFPSLCLKATGENFADTAAGAGFDDSLTGALEGKGGYQVRFFFLDCLGWLQNFFH